MLQTLFTIGNFPIHTYGLALAVGFLFGIYFSSKRAIKFGEKPEFISDLSVYVILGSIIGARLLYVFLNFSEFEKNLISIINPVQADGTFGIGGLVFIGGLILASIVTVFYIRFKKRSILKVLDIILPPAAFGLAIGRIGCVLNGCCYGKSCDLPWALSFPSETPAGYYQHLIHADKLHPAQVYMVLGALIVGILLLLLERFKKFDGHNAFLFVIFYGIDRSTVDFFRYYPKSELHLGFTHNQWILAFAIVISTTLFLIKYKKHKQDE